MKTPLYVILAWLSLFTSCKPSTSIEREQDFNFDWKFALNIDKDASAPDYPDSNWRNLQLPHDWSVELEFDSVKGEGCTAYLLGGIGWYRKHFITEAGSNERVYILFDGIYNHSEVWLNGSKVGERPYGYVPFYFDLTPHLRPKGQNNVIAVKVDHSRYADSRWYSGSGIYRNVKLITTPNLHIPVWGTFVTTPKVTKDLAKLNIQTSIKNDSKETQSCQLRTMILDPKGKTVAKAITEVVCMSNDTKVLTQNVDVKSPMLWGLDHPQQYTMVTQIIGKGKTIDSYTTPFGIRSIRWDKDKGFFLNDENMKIKGVCLHHDGGLVGAAVPKAVWKRRLQMLKDGGCNAIRMSHNPASDELLDLCDEMGFLVQDEFFDEWDNPKDKRLNMQEQHDDYITRGLAEYFQVWAHKDLKNAMLAHRNHPSVFQWSIGNEIEWTYPRNKKSTGFFDNMNWDGNYFWSPTPFTPAQIKDTYNSQKPGKYAIENTAQKLADWTRELDTSRPVIANCILPSASFETGYADALDIVGFSYRRVMYDYAKMNYPNKIVMGTENVCQYHEWKAIEDRPFISGTFLWTGIDYMGEANGAWPRRNTTSGLLDQAGFAKPSYHMYATLWQDKPHIYICSNTSTESKYRVKTNGAILEKKPGAWKHTLWSWHHVNEHWNYKNGQNVMVEVISNCPEVELFLNDKSLGVKQLSQFEDHIYKWTLPFEAGNLVSKGTKDGTTVETKITTASDPVSIQITSDKTKLEADGYDAAHIIVQLVDKDGNPVMHQNKDITFRVEGDIKVLGVDNGAANNVQKYHNNKIHTHHGRAMMIVQAKQTAGTATITTSMEGQEMKTFTLAIK